MKAEYLKGLSRRPVYLEDLHIGSVEFIGSGSDMWCVGSYSRVKKHYFKPLKKALVEITNVLENVNTNIAGWDWHHVVESQHLSYILSSQDLYGEHWYHMPTILISKKEHRYFSRNLTNKAFRIMTNTQRGKRKVINGFMPSSIKEQREIKYTAVKLKGIYNDMYFDYPTLRKIANNVFDYHIARLGVF